MKYPNDMLAENDTENHLQDVRMHYACEIIGIKYGFDIVLEILKFVRDRNEKCLSTIYNTSYF